MNKKKQIAKLDINMKKRIINTLIVSLILLILLLLRIAWIQFFTTVEGQSLRELARRQQIASRSITPRRGNIFDSTRKPPGI